MAQFWPPRKHIRRTSNPCGSSFPILKISSRHVKVLVPRGLLVSDGENEDVDSKAKGMDPLGAYRYLYYKRMYR